MTILRERLDDNPQKVEGSFSRKHGTLRVSGDKMHFWSPCLDLTIIEADDSSTHGTDTRGESDPRPVDVKSAAGPATKVWGTFSPRPEIWVGFVFAIGVCAVIAFISLLFAIAQLMLGHTPWALLVPIGAILVGVGVYTSAIVGQGLSIGEMYRIRSYLDECLKEAESRAQLHPPTRTDSSSQL